MFATARNFLRHLGTDNANRWDPMLAVVYLTYRCSFRCPYCSDGAGQPYYRLRATDLDARRFLDLLASVRRHCEHVVLTGGEPLEHPGLAAILAAIPKLGFETVVLTTNGHDLGRFLPLPKGSITDLVLSLDTLDQAKADAWYGRGPGTLAAILRTHEAVREKRGRGFGVTISTVITPDNLDDIDDVYDHAKAHGFRFAACPQLVGTTAHPALGSDPRYVALYDRLIREKRAGADVYGTIPYLQAMRDLSPFSCRPFTMLTVSPEGNVFYPCLEIGHVAGNLLEETDLGALRRNAAATAPNRRAERSAIPRVRWGSRCSCATLFASSRKAASRSYAQAETWHRGYRVAPSETAFVMAR